MLIIVKYYRKIKQYKCVPLAPRSGSTGTLLHCDFKLQLQMKYFTINNEYHIKVDYKHDSFVMTYSKINMLNSFLKFYKKQYFVPVAPTLPYTVFRTNLFLVKPSLLTKTNNSVIISIISINTFNR